MKRHLAALLIACLACLPPAHAHGTSRPSVPPAGRSPARPTPAQLREDFDQAVGFLEAFSVHMDLNARRLGIDYPKQFRALREEIVEGTDVCDFSRLLERTLRLAQDLHVGTMDLAYLQAYGKLQSRFNIGDDDAYEGVAAVEAACASPPRALDLPLIFVDGQYVFYADVSYQGETIRRGTRAIHYNGQDIQAHVRAHPDTVWPVRVTADGTAYSLRFHRSAEQQFRLGLSDGRQLAFDNGKAVEWITPNRHPIYFGSQTEARVLHFADQGLLYIGLPMMDESLVDGINAQVDDIARAGGRIDKIAIDVRGNGGGSDMTWRRLLSHLVDRDMQLALDLRMKDTALARRHYAPEKPSPAAPVEWLGGAGYWLHNGNVVTWAPDEDSLRFGGPIYVLRDAYIYSSAANLADFANRDPQLVTVGEPSDLVGGAQIEPLFFKLDHTGLVFRVEPALDFSGVRTLDDFAHNQVEVLIRPGVEEQFLRSTYAGDIYGREFLQQHDPLFRYVLSQ